MFHLLRLSLSTIIKDGAFILMEMPSLVENKASTPGLTHREDGPTPDANRHAAEDKDSTLSRLEISIMDIILLILVCLCILHSSSCTRLMWPHYHRRRTLLGCIQALQLRRCHKCLPYLLCMA